MNKNTAIKVQNLTKTYKLYDKPIDRLKESLHPLKKKYHKDFYALNDLSFEIKKGETVGIVGENGSGKSTLLKIITGVLTPTNGRVSIHGKISAILELGAGFNPEMTGLENIYLNTSINGVSKQETDKKIDEIVAFAELGEFIHQPIKTYSSGMQARLAFAVSINVEPDILIVDEALAVGDMNFQAKCMTAMERIRSRGTTVLFVSHSIDSIKSLCQKAVYLKCGKMIAEGEAKDISELYLKDMREEQNIHHKPQPASQVKNANNYFKMSDEFEKRVTQFRYGSGGVRILNVELLDLNDNELKRVEFNQEVKIKIYVESDISKENVSINFQLFDAKRIMLTVGNFRVLEKEYLNVKPHSRYIVEYTMKLPLQQGNYSFQTTTSSPIIEDETAEFIDVVPDSVVFQMARRPVSRIWGKIHMSPSLKIEEL